jgi:hypothetical protein
VENLDRHIKCLNVVASYVSGMPNANAATAVAASTSAVCNACNHVTADLACTDLLYVLPANNIILLVLLLSVLSARPEAQSKPLPLCLYRWPVDNRLGLTKFVPSPADVFALLMGCAHHLTIIATRTHLQPHSACY